MPTAPSRIPPRYTRLPPAAVALPALHAWLRTALPLLRLPRSDHQRYAVTTPAIFRFARIAICLSPVATGYCRAHNNRHTYGCAFNTRVQHRHNVTPLLPLRYCRRLHGLPRRAHTVHISYCAILPRFTARATLTRRGRLLTTGHISRRIPARFTFAYSPRVACYFAAARNARLYTRVRLGYTLFLVHACDQRHTL